MKTHTVGAETPHMPSTLRVNIENAVKWLVLISILFWLMPNLSTSFQIMFQNDVTKAGDLLLAISTLVVGSMFAYFSFSYSVVRKDLFIFRLLVYLKTLCLLFSILLTLFISSILFPIFLGGLHWLFNLLCYTLIAACFLYDIVNVQIMGKDHE